MHSKISSDWLLIYQGFTTGSWDIQNYYICSGKTFNWLKAYQQKWISEIDWNVWHLVTMPAMTNVSLYNQFKMMFFNICIVIRYFLNIKPLIYLSKNHKTLFSRHYCLCILPGKNKCLRCHKRIAPKVMPPTLWMKCIQKAVFTQAELNNV